MYTYTANPLSLGVIRSDGANIPNDPDNSDYQAYLAWIGAGNSLGPVPQLSLAQLITQASVQIQLSLDQLAQSWGYNDSNSASTYVNSGNPKFKAEGTAISNWRDSVWMWAETQQAGITAGTTPMPASVPVFMASMPAAPARPTVAL